MLGGGEGRPVPTPAGAGSGVGAGAGAGAGSGAEPKTDPVAAPAPPCAAGCGAVSTSRCAGCKTVRYCGRACQRAHWKQHKRVCGQSGSGAGAGAGPTPTPTGDYFYDYDATYDDDEEEDEGEDFGEPRPIHRFSHPPRGVTTVCPALGTPPAADSKWARRLPPRILPKEAEKAGCHWTQVASVLTPTVLLPTRRLWWCGATLTATYCRFPFHTNGDCTFDSLQPRGHGSYLSPGRKFGLFAGGMVCRICWHGFAIDGRGCKSCDWGLEEFYALYSRTETDTDRMHAMMESVDAHMAETLGAELYAGIKHQRGRTPKPDVDAAVLEAADPDAEEEASALPRLHIISLPRVVLSRVTSFLSIRDVFLFRVMVCSLLERLTPPAHWVAAAKPFRVDVLASEYQQGMDTWEKFVFPVFGPSGFYHRFVPDHRYEDKSDDWWPRNYLPREDHERARMYYG